MPMLGPCAQRQRYATACCAYRPTFIRCLSINPPPLSPPEEEEEEEEEESFFKADAVNEEEEEEEGGGGFIDKQRMNVGR